MKKIVLLGLLFLLAGTNTPSTIQAKQDGVLKNSAKTVGSALYYVFLTTPCNACKAGVKAVLDIGKAGGKTLKHTGLAIGNAFRHISSTLGHSGVALINAVIFITAVFAIVYGLESALIWAFDLGLPQLITNISGKLGHEIVFSTNTFRELIIAQYNYLAPIITSNASGIIETLKNTNYLETIKSIPAFIKALPGMLYVFCKQMPQAFKIAFGNCKPHLKLICLRM